MSIAQNAMCVNLMIGTWLGYRFDKEASRQLTQDNNADQDAARVNKHLVSKASLKPIITAAGAVRTHFYAKTLPWKDNGDRLLTRKMYESFIQKHEELVDAFDIAVDRFLELEYPMERERAQFRMGNMYNHDDFPSVMELRRKFYISMDIDAVTEAGDFRVEMDQAELDRVRSGIEQAMGARLGRAMADVWGRLAEIVGHYSATMNASDKIFRDSTVRNLEEIVELLPDLNILDDPQLEKIRQDIEAKLIGVDPKDIRKDPAVRAQVGGEAAQIMQQMDGFMRAMQAAA